MSGIAAADQEVSLQMTGPTAQIVSAPLASGSSGGPHLVQVRLPCSRQHLHTLASLDYRGLESCDRTLSKQRISYAGGLFRTKH